MTDDDAVEHDEVLAGLIHRADLDGLVRLVDDCCAARDWARLRRLRDAARHAVGTGRQLWPAATLAEYRLALLAPAAWAAGVLDEGSGRFSIGPLTEVIAQHHTWSELAGLLEPGPRAAFVAQERVLRGEAIDPAAAAALPDVLELPYALGAWEPAYALATYGEDGGEFPAPDLPARLADVVLPSGAPTVVDDDAVELAVRQLVEPWTTSSNGRADVVAVEGDAAGALRALGVPRARWAPLAARMPSPGSPGPVRAAGPTVDAAAQPPGASARSGSSPRWSTPSTTGRCPSTSSAPLPTTCAGGGGTPTSRPPAGSCSSSSRIPPSTSPGRSALATRHDPARRRRAAVAIGAAPDRRARAPGHRRRRLVGTGAVDGEGAPTRTRPAPSCPARSRCCATSSTAPPPCAARPVRRPNGSAGSGSACPSPGLEELAEVVFDVTAPIVPVTHPQPFRGDLVLARGRVPKDLAGRPLTCSWTARRLDLVADRSSPHALRFEDVASFPLGEVTP